MPHGVVLLTFLTFAYLFAVVIIVTIFQRFVFIVPASISPFFYGKGLLFLSAICYFYPSQLNVLKVLLLSVWQICANIYIIVNKWDMVG